MRIIGLDPGLARVGYGVVEFKNSRLSCLEYGCIVTAAEDLIADRLYQIEQELSQILDDHQPDEMAFERLYFNQNKTSAMMVAQARGVELLIARRRNIPLYEYTPGQIKQAITGYGRAEKRQIQEGVKRLLCLAEYPQPDDAADGLAIAITHAFAQSFKDQHQMR